MKSYIHLSLFLLSAFFLFACANGQTQTTNLSPAEFSEKIKSLPNAKIIDVRTPQEFSNGHLINAQNIDWNGNNFDKLIEPLDKSKPVFVYCLSGGRSSSAASAMRSNGFKEVYELNGGIMKWRGANLPETLDKTSTANEMTKESYYALLNSDKLVLIDFYAEWCAPCKKMKPYLEEIAKDLANKVTVVRIDADGNKQLCKELGVESLPVLFLYKNKEIIWKNQGYIEKSEVVKQLQ